MYKHGTIYIQLMGLPPAQSGRAFLCKAEAFARHCLCYSTDSSRFFAAIEGIVARICIRSLWAGCLNNIFILAVHFGPINGRDTELPNHLYVEELHAALNQTVTVIRAMGEMRDPYTAEHERRVGDLAAAIGTELGLDERRQEGLRIAGYLHDIGKIAIPMDILSKPGRLSAAEFELIKEHAAKGHEILSKADFPWPVALVAMQHHERMDGSGYPQGIKGEQISLKARIVAIADVVESMSAHRPYRAAHGIKKALAEIERGKGSAFDADAVDACLRVVRRKGYKVQD
jgi:putative nucleotidyltransferase with HDIG domain